MQAALAVADKATPVEQALISALPARYPQREPIDDQTHWDKAFTARDAQGLREPIPTTSTSRSVFVEAIMNETPWQMWDLKTGGVAEGAGTDEARRGARAGVPRHARRRGTIPACCTSTST